MRHKKLVFIAGAACCSLVALGGCLALSPHPMDNSAIDEYATAAKPPAGDERRQPSVEIRDAGIARWQALLSDFSTQNLRGKVAEVYADELFFNDTLKTIRRSDQLEAYLLETAEALQFGKVTYEDVAQSGADTYVRWRMVYRSKKLSPKQDIVTVGMSHLRFDQEGKVVLHQDFWDSTRGVFEHVPLLGAGIRAIKKRL